MGYIKKKNCRLRKIARNIVLQGRRSKTNYYKYSGTTVGIGIKQTKVSAHKE